MSPRLEPRVLTLVVDASAPARLVAPPADAYDHEVLDRLAGWLAEVSAEDARRGLLGEAEPPALKPTS
jgi:hypothetical protein